MNLKYVSVQPTYSLQSLIFVFEIHRIWNLKRALSDITQVYKMWSMCIRSRARANSDLFRFILHVQGIPFLAFSLACLTRPQCLIISNEKPCYIMKHASIVITYFIRTHRKIVAESFDRSRSLKIEYSKFHFLHPQPAFGPCLMILWQWSLYGKADF